MQYADKFERKFIQVVSELVLDSGMNHSDFAKIALKDMGGPVAKWRRMRNAWKSSEGRPQRIYQADAVRMAEALGKSYAELCFIVEQRLKIDQQEGQSA
ncbi:hypothetical protein JCM16814_28290 [Desulfobaculum senezii]